VGEVVEIFGTGEPGTDVDVLVGGSVIGAARVGADGRWRFGLVFGAVGVQMIGCRISGDDRGPAIAAYVVIFPALPMVTPTPAVTATVDS
jgi:hypothetical protein